VGGGIRVRDLPIDVVISRCVTGQLHVDYGAANVRVRCSFRDFARTFHLVYGSFNPAPDAFELADYHVQIRSGHGFRALVRKQSRFLIDGVEPFEPFPASSALPLFEWGVNWCFAQRANQYVVLHAGALALGEEAVIMAAPPGSGKSTLAAAMMLRGFRLLSDEFGVLRPETGDLLPMLKPVALKNQSVEVIRSFSDGAVIGPLFTGTRKGDVAHLAPNDRSADAVHRPAQPKLVLFPTYESGARLEARRLPGEEAFARLAFNSFNYHLLGPIGFDAVADVIESCPAFELRYSDLDHAIERIGELLDEAGERRTSDTA
jgi:HprK-related kinase A